MADININIIKEISGRYGDAFYLLDMERFRNNFIELQKSMCGYYKNSFIAYSYKTNYIPKICKMVNELGGYAEIVSEMELEIAKKSGVELNKIIFNGPYKDVKSVCELLFNGGIVNVDSVYDFNIIEEIAKNYSYKRFSIGIRCNFDISDGIVSRFGFDINGDEFFYVLNRIKELPNCELLGYHCHFASRNLEHWKNKVKGMIDIIENYYPYVPKYVCFGGGIFGKMDESLKSQFNCYIPSYQEYAEVIAKGFADKFNSLDREKQPMMFIEPGSALSADTMKFVSKIMGIKNIKGKNIATLLGSVYNINPTLNGKNPPIEIISENSGYREFYNDLDMGGYTCLESDYLYKGFNGNLEVGDYAVFGNIGSYSIVLKPPFILPNFPILEIVDNKIIEVKRGEVFDDLFRTYIF